MTKIQNPLEEAWAKKITGEVRAIKKRIQGGNRRVNEARADIGDRCIEMKKRLKRTHFGIWCAAEITPDQQRIAEYINLGKWRARNFRTFGIFSHFEPCRLDRVAALPPEIADTLTPDTVLPVPGTDLRLPLELMGYRKLDAALDALEGRKSSYDAFERRLTACVSELRDLEIKDPKKFSAALPALREIAGCGDGALPAEKEALAKEILRRLRALRPLLKLVGGAAGTLSGQIKGVVAEEYAAGREETLHWPAVYVPRKKGIIRPGP